MSRTLPTPVAAIGALFAVLAILVASYCIARTPGAVLGGDFPGAAPVSADRTQVPYTLEEGRSAGDIGKDLEKLGVIRSARQFELLASMMGVHRQLSAGDFLLAKNSSTLSVLNRLTVQDLVPVLKVTFPEGIRFEEMAVLADQAGFGSREAFIAAVGRATLPVGLAGTLPEGADLQGYLFPDTYILPEASTMDDLVALMIETLDERFSPELRAAALAQGLNPHQALTLAAVVEREAVLQEERSLIAGVFYNRLAENDRLEADPTVQFAVALDQKSVDEFGWWKKELTILDLENPSPHNTRRLPGLPPGPITNPGLASIEAVAHPAKTDYYYFVADAVKADGSHVFAVTFAEHERNVATVGGQ